MYLSPEEKAIGAENFCAAVGSQPLCRDLLKEAIKADVASRRGLGPMYFHYGASVPEPVHVGVIGTGDEGNVLLSSINPKYIAVKSIADIRPYNVWRAFHGDCFNESTKTAPSGLMGVYDWKTEEEARKNVKVYGPYEELLANAKADGVEAVILALPLHLHAPAAVAAMKAGLHVLTETLMARTVRECKEMARVANQTNLLLATGLQRHYNILYEDAAAILRSGLLGELHHVRAQWHLGNLPGKDAWQRPMPKAAKPDDPLADNLDEKLKMWSADIDKLKRDKKKEKEVANLEKKIAQLRAQIEDSVDAKRFGYVDSEIKDASGKAIYTRPAIEELFRWRLWDRTGAGLMAELGGHLLDATSIFIAAAHGGQSQLPLTVDGSANRQLFAADREIDDHAYCLIEFPAPGYDPKDTNVGARKKIGVQCSIVNGTEFGGYGETVFGTEGTLLLDAEKEAMLYRTHEASSKIKVVPSKKGPTLKVDEAGDPESEAIGVLGTLPAERGHAEELEHWAWCIRNRDPKNLPHGHPKAALAAAVVALTANVAAQKGQRIEFKKEWFDVESDETPEGEKPDVSRYK